VDFCCREIRLRDPPVRARQRYLLLVPRTGVRRATRTNSTQTTTRRCTRPRLEACVRGSRTPRAPLEIPRARQQSSHLHGSHHARACVSRQEEEKRRLRAGAPCDATRGSRAQLLLPRNPSVRLACESEATISAARATHRRAPRDANEQHTYDHAQVHARACPPRMRGPHRAQAMYRAAGTLSSGFELHCGRRNSSGLEGGAPPLHGRRPHARHRARLGLARRRAARRRQRQQHPARLHSAALPLLEVD
jgi:hypothetical protein